MGVMRHTTAMVLALWAGLVGGCFTVNPEQAPARRDAARPFSGPTGEDVVQLFVALVERPVGDRVLNREVWELADEQLLEGEHKVLLEDNGFRVGLLAGQPPPCLQELIDNERSRAALRRIRLRANHPTAVPLGPPWPRCTCT